MSFFGKIKKDSEVEKIEEQKTAKRKTKKIEKTKTDSDFPAPPPSQTGAEEKSKDWFEQEGQLVVDVYQTDGYIFIQSAIAGVNPQNLDIMIENDVVTIKGERERPVDDVVSGTPKDYFYQECYWGPFTRQIILPAEVDGSRVEAEMKEGVLTIKIPKIGKERKRKISVKE